MRGTNPTLRSNVVSVLTLRLIVDDINNQKAASLAKLVDPNGERTIGQYVSNLCNIDSGMLTDNLMVRGLNIS